MSDVTLVSPMASGSRTRTPAPRWNGIDGTIIVSDSMLNTEAGWGSGIQSAVGEAFTRASPSTRITTVTRPQIGDHRPHEWVEELAAGGVSGLVVTAGDCATCTSRALRECVLAEDAGIPATAIVPEALTDIVTATLESWSRPDLRVAWLTEPLFRWRPGSIATYASGAAKEAWEILTDH